MTKINIGSYKSRINGYTGVDIGKFSDCVDVVVESFIKLPYEDNSIEEIYCSHVLEHFTPKECQKVLSEWNRVLMPNGKIYIAVPDMDKFKEIWDRYGFMDIVRDIIYNWETDEPIFVAHKNGFNFETLHKCMSIIGFKDIYKIEKMPYGLQDCSDAYFRDTTGEFINMSLNIEASK